MKAEHLVLVVAVVAVGAVGAIAIASRKAPPPPTAWQQITGGVGQLLGVGRARSNPPGHAAPPQVNPAATSATAVQMKKG